MIHCYSNHLYTKMVVNIEVEYCGTCGYAAKFEEMKKTLETSPNIYIKGFEGRRASFEVTINDILVHSKLSTMAFPDVQDMSHIISDFEAGKELRTCKEQPITDCVIM